VPISFPMFLTILLLPLPSLNHITDGSRCYRAFNILSSWFRNIPDDQPTPVKKASIDIVSSRLRNDAIGTIQFLIPSTYFSPQHLRHLCAISRFSRLCSSCVKARKRNTIPQRSFLHQPIAKRKCVQWVVRF
jgi:hypothetical protein